MDIGDNQRLYVGKFLPKSNAIFYSQTPKIFLNMTINNKTKSQRLNIGMYAFDSEYDPWNKTFDDNFSRTLNFTNLHYLTPYQYHTFMYSRKVRKTLDNSFVNYIGYKNAYSSKYYIESSTQSSPLNLNYSYNIVIEINAQSFIMEENIEQRSSSVLNILGNIFGYYGGISTIYKLLFGERIDESGAVHKFYKCIKTNEDSE
ncbi:hypothetical protein C2G38_2055111 [Gigaspora rosea]|uniref:Uncharacterized protein n=1 Tax=Gigaspora rosea TaxID=44941 RepID=A0A397W5L7_9GLOM|nr:hypothetical protein C2G38_2055111 [Gigaspora rosea]